MGQRYSQLTLEERCRLRGLIEMRLSKVEIARRLGRHRSTVDRELARNSNVDGYRPDTADRRAWVRRFRGSRIERSTRLSADIEDRLAMGWSPEQIAGRMELEGVEHAVCTESIYRHVFSPAGRRAGLPKLLPQHKSLRGRRARNGRREPSIPNRSSIDQRPKSAEDRQEFGHWEGDLMRFRRQRDILLTLQERSTRLTLARRLHSKDAPATADAIVDKLDGRAARNGQGQNWTGRILLRPSQPLAARRDRERQRPPPPRPAAKGASLRLPRHRHLRHRLDAQLNPAKMPRLPDAHRGFRSAPRCRT